MWGGNKGDGNKGESQIRGWECMAGRLKSQKAFLGAHVLFLEFCKTMKERIMIWRKGKRLRCIFASLVDGAVPRVRGMEHICGRIR